MKKKLLKWLLSAAVFSGILSFGAIEYSYAAETQAVGYSEDYAFKNRYEAVEYLNTKLLKYSESINITLSKDLYGSNNAAEVFLDILGTAPAYYEISNISYTITYIDGGARFSLYPSYRVTEEENRQLIAAIDEALDELSLDGKSEYQKVRAIHDYICDRVDYDYTYTKYTAYDALIGGEAVCQGYATLFYRMCYEEGLSVSTISGIGNGGAHAWNIVKIGAVYYNIDTTWDGQSEKTLYSYFLRNEADFGDHYRDSQYATDEFYSKYPMANDSWMDYSTVKESTATDNIDQVVFNTIDGSTITNQAENGRGKLLIFGADGCAYTRQTLISIASADFSDIDVVFIESNYSSLAAVENMKDSYGSGNEDIVYVYSLDYTALSAMWDYVEVTFGEMTTFPLLVYIDSDNKIQYAEKSGIYTAGHIRGIVDAFLYDNKLAELSKNSLTINGGNTEQLMIYIYGMERNAQFFTWTSSNPTVATVDEDGKIKALKTGTTTIMCRINEELYLTCEVTVDSTVIADGLNRGNDGVWRYYKNGTVDTSYTGMAKNQYGWWYVKKGILDTTYTGMAKNAYGWWYMKKGKLDQTYTGMAKNDYGWWYMKNGKLDTTYTGMAKNDYGWWYMKNGKLDQTYTGMAKNDYGWWYMKDGKLDQTYTGMAKNAYGWWYMKNGKLDTTYTGISSNAYGQWYMKNGKLDTTFTGTITYNGVSYRIIKGKVS